VRCEVVRSRGGFAIVCGGRRQRQPPCYRDGRPATIQCDFTVGRRNAGVATNVPVSCDRWCCDDTSCSMKVGPNRHFCRGHYDERARDLAAAVASIDSTSTEGGPGK
jgi:hypothetical protein